MTRPLLAIAALASLIGGLKPMVGGGARESLLGVIHRADRTTKVTYAEHPLYRFAGDRRPGQTTGQDTDAFGGGWYVLAPTGKKIDRG